MAAITATEIIALLELKPLPVEGGYYAETYRSDQLIAPNSGVVIAESPRHLSTAIFYLLTPETFSALHRLPGPEVYHFYLGDPVDLTVLHPDGRVDEIPLGIDLRQGMRPQVVVPGGVWQGSRLRDGGHFALMGTTMSPGFHHDDFELGDRQHLEAMFPVASGLIARLTR